MGARCFPLSANKKQEEFGCNRGGLQTASFLSKTEDPNCLCFLINDRVQDIGQHDVLIHVALYDWSSIFTLHADFFDILTVTSLNQYVGKKKKKKFCGYYITKLTNKSVEFRLMHADGTLFGHIYLIAILYLFLIWFQQVLGVSFRLTVP